jgi:hypothetical protein
MFKIKNLEKMLSSQNNFSWISNIEYGDIMIGFFSILQIFSDEF